MNVTYAPPVPPPQPTLAPDIADIANQLNQLGEHPETAGDAELHRLRSLPTSDATATMIAPHPETYQAKFARRMRALLDRPQHAAAAASSTTLATSPTTLMGQHIIPQQFVEVSSGLHRPSKPVTF